MSRPLQSALAAAKHWISIAAIGAVCFASALVSPANAADPATPDWPCIWRKVIALDAGTIWDGPDIAGGADWMKDDQVRDLSKSLIIRRFKIEEAEAAIKKFAEAQPADVRDKKLLELFTGILSRTNDERKVVLGGIERFHKRQLARAKEIEKEGVVLPRDGQSLPTDPTAATEIDKLSDEEEKYKWEIRVFQERQQNIPVACEIPQLMDERAGALARAIRAEMKS